PHQPPFSRATWGVYVLDDGKVLFARNADRFYVPASNTKLVVSAAATVLLPADYRVTTSVYANGRVDNGVLYGDLVLYGRGDPTWSERCFSVDSLAPGACDSAFTAVAAIADSIRARGLKRVTGKLVGDGSYFEPVLVHPGWNAWDLNWWYAAPVSGLGFHDNSVDFHIAPGAAVDQPPTITWSPELGLFTFENRARTVPADSSTTIGDNFFRTPGTWDIWAEGTEEVVADGGARVGGHRAGAVLEGEQPQLGRPRDRGRLVHGGARGDVEVHAVVVEAEPRNGGGVPPVQVPRVPAGMDQHRVGVGPVAHE